MAGGTGRGGGWRRTEVNSLPPSPFRAGLSRPARCAGLSGGVAGRIGRRHVLGRLQVWIVLVTGWLTLRASADGEVSQVLVLNDSARNSGGVCVGVP